MRGEVTGALSGESLHSPFVRGARSPRTRAPSAACFGPPGDVALDARLHVPHPVRGSWPQRFTGESMGAGQVKRVGPHAGTNAIPRRESAGLAEPGAAFVTSLAHTGAPTANGTPIGAVPGRARRGCDGDGLRPREVAHAGADSEATLSAQIRMAHNCAFWNRSRRAPATRRFGRPLTRMNAAAELTMVASSVTLTFAEWARKHAACRLLG